MTALSKKDAKRFQRLYASQDDLLWADAFAGYIERKKLHHLPWGRKNSYFQSYAFTSAMVTAYGRVFMDLPKQGKDWLATLQLSAEEIQLHFGIMKLRHEIFAHSNTKQSKAYPVRYGERQQFITTAMSPLTSFSPDEIVLVKALISKLQKAMSIEMGRLMHANGFGA